ncbi:hypothetical protein [Streptomyces sp. Z26]|uniref:hypothetical protein n=1 Tax=Streptomyces sp. Z26 TaxID=2500177 RepID=UPI000EF13E75|nr:hypothetical protein [Streptomyces sp. Z26]RLL69367.1 hypothetical protein D7M15_23880 [Streptomyces sp. Z26]
MSGESGPAHRQEPPTLPNVGTLVVDTTHQDRIGEFRGTIGPFWALRPVGGGREWEAPPEGVRLADPREWEAPPEGVRLADPRECLSALNARCNARSRGEVL